MRLLYGTLSTVFVNKSPQIFLKCILLKSFCKILLFMRIFLHIQRQDASEYQLLGRKEPGRGLLANMSHLLIPPTLRHLVSHCEQQDADLDRPLV